MVDERKILNDLRCCTISGERDCANCTQTNWLSCRDSLMRGALELIESQKAEIEELQTRIENLQARIDALNHTNKILMDTEDVVKMNVRNFAIIEFADKLKEYLRFDDCEYDCEDCCYSCKDYVPFIQNLVREMTAEKGGDGE